jgi:predicted cobalt transporter CbtA
MVTMTLGRTVGHGALAGAVAGGIGAAAQYWLVVPSIRAAITIEETGAAASPADSHGDMAANHASGHSHAAGAVVSRGEQVVVGTVTVLVVGILIGIAFALVHRFLRDRLPGTTAAGSVMALAGLGFISFTLAPAIAIPANPPSVGDPATVTLRTLTYLATIVSAVALTAMVTGLGRAKDLAPGERAVAATAAGIIGTAVLLWALPDPAAVPADVPADLIWHFRIGSLTQIGLMWLFLGATFGWLSTAREPKRTVVPHAVSTHA